SPRRSQRAHQDGVINACREGCLQGYDTQSSRAESQGHHDRCAGILRTKEGRGDMRISRAVLAVTAIMLLFVAGCSKEVAGTAKQDPKQPPLALSEDGQGIVAGYPDAPVQFELYTEPQCNHCAQLQADFGDDIDHYINLG